MLHMEETLFLKRKCTYLLQENSTLFSDRRLMQLYCKTSLFGVHLYNYLVDLAYLSPSQLSSHKGGLYRHSFVVMRQRNVTSCCRQQENRDESEEPLQVPEHEYEENNEQTHVQVAQPMPQFCCFNELREPVLEYIHA